MISCLSFPERQQTIGNTGFFGGMELGMGKKIPRSESRRLAPGYLCSDVAVIINVALDRFAQNCVDSVAVLSAELLELG